MTELPPLALDDERVLMTQLIDGRPLRAIHPLTGRDFFLPLHRSVVYGVAALDALGRRVTVESVTRALMAQGWHERVLDDVKDLDERPYVRRLWPHIKAVREASRARELLATLRDVEVAIQTRAVSVDEALDTLRRCASRGAHGSAPFETPDAGGRTRSVVELHAPRTGSTPGTSRRVGI